MDLFGVIAGTVVIFFFFLFIALMLLAVVEYLLTAIGLSRVAKNKGFSKSWLAWIPYANYWLTGAVADKIEVENGNRVKYAKYITGFLIAATLFIIPGEILSTIGSVLLELEPELAETAAVFSLISLPFSFISSGLGIAYTIFYYIAVFKIFKHFAPQKATLYLVLSIIVPLALGICLIKCAKAYTPIVSEEVSPEA